MTREESRQQTRRRLLDAAARVFAKRGYRGASVEEISSEAGYTIGALYSNFSGKEEVLLALLEQRVARIAERIVTAALERGRHRPTSCAPARANGWTFLDDEPELYALMVEFWTIWVRDEEQRPHHGRRFAAVREYIGGLIQEKADEMGVTMRLPPDQIGAVVMALADGLGAAVPRQPGGRAEGALPVGAADPDPGAGGARPVSSPVDGSRRSERDRGAQELIGTEIGPGEWREVRQQDIDTFADLSGDHQWIHVDTERAKQESPFGTTIAHGNLTLSMIDGFRLDLITTTGFKLGVNYGWNKVRFPAPVPAGSRVRAKAEVISVDEVGGGWWQVVTRFTVEVEGSDKPCCVADSVGRALAA